MNISHLTEAALDLINCELDIIKMELDFPGRFLFDETEATAISRPLAQWNGTVAELLEYMIPLHVSGKLLKPTGEPMTWAGVVKHIELVCGVTVPDLYDRKAKILNRYKNTAFLDKMRQVVVEAAQR